MVTASAELAKSPEAMRALSAAGMDVLRINGAHDSPEVWRALAASARAAAAATGRACRILVDLAGPKVRTGAIEPGPRVISWHPKRDARGAVPVPVRVWIGAGPAPSSADLSLPLADGALTSVRAGDLVRIEEVRGRRRDLPVLAATWDGILVTSDRSAWIAPGAKVHRLVDGALAEALGVVGDLPALPGGVRLSIGDTLVVTRDPAPGRGARDGAAATVPCTLPEVFAAVRPGAPILFDDGRIEGVVDDVDAERLTVRITRARRGGDRLAADKGINLPETNLPVPALTAVDLLALDVVVGFADLIGLSFVRRPEDVHRLHEALAARGASSLGIVLKIETRLGFENLPALLLAAMRSPRVGVMIARGDLAVECGFMRLAEVQEEILWICEAAHVPAIWATQVLDTLARTGVATRAEITDAAFGQRAECVMLNKGPHAAEAVAVLGDILERMSAHQRKKSAMLRRLRSLAPGG